MTGRFTFPGLTTWVGGLWYGRREGAGAQVGIAQTGGN